jgi:hypothetical protein
MSDTYNPSLILEKYEDYTYIYWKTEKFLNFVNNRMQNKEIDMVYGIGAIYGEKLRAKGFEKAYHLLGQFLVMSRDQEVFISWLQKEIGFSDKHAHQVSCCMGEWCNNNL